MGLCFSKKEDSPPDENKVEKSSPRRILEEATTGKRTAEVVARDGAGGVPLVPSVDQVFTPVAAFRSLSCTEEEVDAILIQCGRLSRSSSANASAEDGTGRRKYTGSKRSYDFDGERRGDEEEGEWAAKSVSRPSPRRRTPSRERLGSKERGGRRVSRSPSRFPEVPASTGACSDRSRQPVKMVVVPPRDKGRRGSPAASSKRGSETSSMRSSSPRSWSPANPGMSGENATCHLQLQSLSWSSFRTPMMEVDENTARASQNTSKDNKVEKMKGEDGMGKLSQAQSQISRENSVQISKSLHRNGAAESPGNTAIEKPSATVLQELNFAAESCHLKTISGTRSSGDLNQIPGVNQASFSLISCVSKACKLNSTSSEKNHVAERCNRDGDDLFDKFPMRALLPFVEPETTVEDDAWQPNLHKYVTVRKLRDDVEPEESAGSNCFSGVPWASSGWEPHSADASECRRSSRPNSGEEVEQEAKPSSVSHQSQRPVSESIREPETRGRRPRGDSSVLSQSALLNENKQEPYCRAPPSRADGGGKTAHSSGSPLPTAAAS